MPPGGEPPGLAKGQMALGSGPPGLSSPPPPGFGKGGKDSMSSPPDPMADFYGGRPAARQDGTSSPPGTGSPPPGLAKFGKGRDLGPPEAHGGGRAPEALSKAASPGSPNKGFANPYFSGGQDAPSPGTGLGASSPRPA